MTLNQDCVRPPRLALWLVNLFTSTEDADSILGDLLEEFSNLVSKMGVRAARRWFWRQSIATIGDAFAEAWRTSPLSTFAVVACGMLLERFMGSLPDKILSAVTDRYLIYWSNHFHAYMFWATDGMAVAHVVASLIVGCVVALAAKGREMIVTTMLSAILAAMGAVGIVAMLAGPDPNYLWMLPWYLADWIAIVAGGAIVRTIWSAISAHPSEA